MSTLYVDDVAGQGGGTSTNLMSGLVKAWGAYDQNTPTLKDSYNLSSVTDSSTGKFVSVVTNNFSAATFATTGAAGQDTGASQGTMLYVDENAAAPTSSGASMSVQNTAAAVQDNEWNGFSHVGDLA